MDLNAMKNIDVTKVSAQELVDINDVQVNNKLKQENKMMDYIKKIKNPYCYKQGDYIVKIGFEDTAVTLTERLKELILKTANGL